MYVSTYTELEALVDRMRGSDLLAIDTEFHRERTYYPKLCLLQLATEKESAIVDPLAISDLSPLSELITDGGICKIFHAGSQDVEILIHEIGCAPHPVFDTQIAAGLLGHPQQMGYGALVKAYCNVSLEKGDSYTDWTRRPLSATQVEYAIDDVLYLPGIYRTMMEQLQKAGRLDWVSADFAHLSDPDTYAIDVDECWRKVKRISSLTRKQLAVVRAIAAWRETTAQRKNVPRRWILTDEIIVEIARRCPKNASQLFEVRGLQDRLTERSVHEVLDATAQALKSDPDTWPKTDHHGSPKGEDEGIVDLLGVLLRLKAKENGVSVQFLGGKDDLADIARGKRDVDLLKGWRGELVGNDMLALLEGRIALIVEDGSLKVKTV